MKQIAIIMTICGLSACSLDTDEVRLHMWKYGEGSRPGHDLFVFGGGIFRLSNDTILFLDTAIATVTDTKKNYWLYDNEITLKNLKTGKTAIYHDFGKIRAEDTIVTVEIKQMDPQAPPVPSIPPPPAWKK